MHGSTAEGCLRRLTLPDDAVGRRPNAAEPEIRAAALPGAAARESYFWRLPAGARTGLCQDRRLARSGYRNSGPARKGRGRACRLNAKVTGFAAVERWGVSHGIELPSQELFFSAVHLHGGPAPVRRFLPELTGLINCRQIDPGTVVDLDLPLAQARGGIPGHG
jgi:hypothetical protein